MYISTNGPYGAQPPSSNNGENPQLADYLIVIQEILSGSLGNLSASGTDPQTQYLLEALASVITNTTFLSDLSSGTTPLDQQLESLLNNTSYGASMLSDFQAIEAGNMSVIPHLISNLSNSSSPISQFLKAIQSAGLSYTPPANSGNYYNNLAGVENGFPASVFMLFSDLQNAPQEAQYPAQELGSELQLIYDDAVASPADPYSQLFVALFNAPSPELGALGYPNQSLITFINNDIMCPNPSMASMQALSKLFSQNSNSLNSLGNIIENLITQMRIVMNPS
jgi:hypothetical protein